MRMIVDVEKTGCTLTCHVSHSVAIIIIVLTMDDSISSIYFTWILYLKIKPKDKEDDKTNLIGKMSTTIDRSR